MQVNPLRTVSLIHAFVKTSWGPQAVLRLPGSHVTFLPPIFLSYTGLKRKILEFTNPLPGPETQFCVHYNPCPYSLFPLAPQICAIIPSGLPHPGSGPSMTLAQSSEITGTLRARAANALLPVKLPGMKLAGGRLVSLQTIRFSCLARRSRHYLHGLFTQVPPLSSGH